MRTAASAAAQADPPARQRILEERPQDALVGRLIAEAEEASCLAEDMQEQLQQLEAAKRYCRHKSSLIFSKCASKQGYACRPIGWGSRR